MDQLTTLHFLPQADLGTVTSFYAPVVTVCLCLSLRIFSPPATSEQKHPERISFIDCEVSSFSPGFNNWYQVFWHVIHPNMEFEEN